MALSTHDADAINETAKKTGKKLAVCFQNRFNAPVQKLRAALEAGRFGRVLHGMVQIRWNRNEAYYAEAPWRGTWEQDGGTLMNQCTHGIDLLQWMLGEDAVRVQAQTRPSNSSRLRVMSSSCRVNKSAALFSHSPAFSAIAFSCRASCREIASFQWAACSVTAPS